jgi:hypothetical protein
MLSLEVFDWKNLVDNPSREIWLSEADLKFYTDGSLFECKGGFWSFFGGT